MCCTSVPAADRQFLHDRVGLLGGTFDRNLTKAVTHVVARQAVPARLAAARAAAGNPAPPDKYQVRSRPTSRPPDLHDLPTSRPPTAAGGMGAGPNPARRGQVALDLQLPLMTEEWLNQCWQMSKTRLCHGAEPALLAVRRRGARGVARPLSATAWLT